MEYVHTCYRVLDLDRSLDFYTNKLGLELARKSPIGNDATNAFLAVPGDQELFFVKDPDGYRIEVIERK